MKPAAAVLLVLAMLAATLVVAVGQTAADPLAPYRYPDGSLHIPGSALTPDLERILFGGNDLQPQYNLTVLVPDRSAYPTMHLLPAYIEVPNLNVFVHPRQRPQSLVGALGHLVQEWFPPVDWPSVAAQTQASLRRALSWFLGLFLMDARAAVTIDSTTVATSAYVNTCTTSQSAGAGDNAILVMLSERGTFAYSTVTYGAVSLSLIANTAVNSGTNARTELWFYQGAIPGGAQTMTATLSGGNVQRQVCATILLAGVDTANPTTGGTTAAGTTANPGISIGPASGALAFAVLASYSNPGPIAPTAVTGTAATATDLYGVATTECTSGGGTTICGAGADLPNPGTAITWTEAATTWAVSAVLVNPPPGCGSGGQNCYRIGAGGSWSSTSNWSNASGGAACACSPAATDNAIFDGNPTGTTTLAAATTIASIDMTGFTGALDTVTGSNWALTINGLFNVQGTFLARNSVVTVAGNVSILTATTIVNLGGSNWTVNGTWTNASTSASWVAGTSTVTISDGASASLTFAALAGATNEFNNLVLDTSLGSGITYTMATNSLRSGGLLTIQNSVGGPTGNTVLTTGAGNLAITAGGITIGTNGTLTANASTITVNGSWSSTAASATWNKGTSTVVFGATGTITLAAGQSFNIMTQSAGTSTLGAALTVTGLLTVNGTLSTSATNFALTAQGGLTVGGSLLTGTSTIADTGNVSVNTPAAFITSSATGSWTVTNGNWTNVTTSASWSFAAPVTFISNAARTMTFKASATEFGGAVTFDSSVATGVTFTMATNALALAGLLTVQNSVGGATGNTVLTTSASNLAITAGSVSVGTRGTLTANGSTITVGGNWTVAAANATFTAGTSTVAFTAAATVNMTQPFNNLTVSAGTSTLAANTSVNAALTVSGGTLAKSTVTLSTATLTLSGGALTSTSGNGTVSGSVSISSAASYIVFGSETWTIAGSWTDSSTSASWNAGTGTVIFNAGASRTMTFGNLPVAEFNNVQFSPTAAATFTMATNRLRWGGNLTLGNNATLATANLALAGGNLTVGNGATLTAGTSTVSVVNVSMTGGTSGTITAAGSWTVSGNWDTSGTGSAFTGTSSTVTMSGAGTTVKILNSSNDFGALTISGTVSAASAISTGGLLTVSGTFDTTATNYGLIVGGGLAVSGATGTLRTNGSSVTVAGNVNINNAAAYATSTATGAWTVSGSWTNASTSSAWGFAAPITFNSASAQTMTFAALPLSAPEFNNVTFNSGASTVTFTMATRGLVWSGTLTAQGGAGTTTLATSNLALTGGALSIGNAGLLTSNASSVNVSNVTMTGGASGTITLTTGAWTVTGSWNTSGAGSALAPGTSTVTFTGAASTINLAAGQRFYNLSISGSVSLASTVTASAALTVANAAVLTKTGQSIAFNSLAETGTGSIVDGAISAVGFTVTNSDLTNITTVSGFSLWSVGTEYTWTDSSTVGTSTLTFIIAGNAVGNRFNVTKNSVLFSTGTVNASGQVAFTMLGSDPVVDVLVLSPCGTSRYWVGGAGSWSQSTHWASSSGGSGGCAAPIASNAVFLDGNAGGGTITVDANAAAASLDTTGWAGTLAIGTFDFVVGGGVTHVAGAITVGASTNLGLRVAGNLTLSGSAVLDGSGAASIVTILGNTAVASATSLFKMGSGTWTFGGSWSNGSTSAGWAAGTGTVLFNSSSSQAMTFANLAGNEFYNVAFQSSAPSGTVTFTMVTYALKWGGGLTIQDAAGSTTALATAGLALTGGSLTVGNMGILIANASAVVAVDVTMAGGVSGTIVLTTGAWTVSGNWDTSGLGSTFTKGASTVTMSGTGRTLRTLNATNGFSSLVISGSVTQGSAIDVSGALTIRGALTTAGYDITGGAALTLSSGGSLTGTTSSIAVAGVTMNDTSANTISLTSGSVSASGSWDTSGATSTFAAGTSTVTLTGTSAAITLGSSQAFATLIISGTILQASPLTASALTIFAGGLTKGANPLTVNGNLTLAGGYLASTSGAVAISGNVNISSVSSYIAFGSEAWTVSGSWTNASTSAAWSMGTGSVTFNASSPETMAFAGANLSGNEFNAVVFNGGSSTVTFTLTSRGLNASTISVGGGSGTTSLDTSAANLPLTAGTLTVASGGALVANSSMITVTSIDTSGGAFTAGTSVVFVNQSGGTVRIPQTVSGMTVGPGIATTFASNLSWSATLTLTGATVTLAGNLTSVGPAALVFGSATISIAGSWNSSSASNFTSTASSVTFTGSGQTIAVGAGQVFAALTIAGTVALATNLAATSLTVPATGALTMTNVSVTFNGLTVTGTITDGSVNVTNLTVGNSDATALVTISAFTEWSAGSAYAWTHSSSESSQTITWTIGGNPAASTYAVTKDGSAFGSGTVNGSGQIIFTMLGSDPTMRVTLVAPVVVVPPASSEWWRAPYVLAIPPIGLLVVVAMFAQRRRWRPTKGFLVDERGQLLREFTLDPSCNVTYEQAMQAGALDAVEKDVKVSKYHARAVRGDVLSLVMLAVGPADVEELEFARGILAGIEEKLDDSVRQRVDEARTEEQNLEATRQQLEVERADLQTRSHVFGDALNATVAAQSKLGAQSEAIHSQSADLSVREAAVAHERHAVDGLAAEVETRRSDLDQRAVEMEKQEKDLATKAQTLEEREATLAPKEATLSQREADLAEKQAGFQEREETLAAAESKVTADIVQVHTQTEALRRQAAELAEERKSFDELATRLEAQESSLKERVVQAEEREEDVVAKAKDLEDLKANLGPRESALLQHEEELKGREKSLADEEAAFQSRQDLVAAKALEIQQQMEGVREKETALAEERGLLDNARGALDAQRKELEGQVAALENETDRRNAELAVQERTLGEAQLRLTRDRQDFEAARTEKEHFIATKEIEIEAREQSLADRSAELRAQGEEHAKRLADLAAREEVLEIDSSKLDKARAELETRKAETAAMVRDHEGKVARFHDEEARKGEELRTWQTTLESEQALLKEQRESFEKEMQNLRESWAGRMLRVEQREEELQEREAKAQADVEWVARSETDLSKREKIATENLKAASEFKAEHERIRKELEQRALEIESRERNLREEAATQSIELQKRTEAIQAMEAEFAGKRAQTERELETRSQRLKDREAELQARHATLDAREGNLATRETELAKQQDALGKSDERLARELADVQMQEKRLDAKQLEFSQDRERLDAEFQRQRSEADAVRQSLAAKEADLNSERERLERESATLQDKLGTKAKELATREKALAAREDELRAEEQDLEARTRENDSRERQTTARAAEIAATQEALNRSEQELKARASRFDEAVAKFEAEAATKRKDWESLQTELKTHEARVTASAESRQAELAKRMEELAQREHSMNATSAQLQIERSRAEAQAKNQAAKQSELDAAGARAEARFAELKKMEDELLQSRQTFESEKSGWSARRSEELRQLEATRDAAAEQTQQAEHLIEEAQRRAYMAAEAEKAAKRQGEDLAAAQAALDGRRLDAEKAEKDLEGQMAQLREASQRLASREMDLNGRAKDLDSRQARLAATEQRNEAVSEEFKARKTSLDHEAERLATLAAQLDKREAEHETRHAAVDAKLADVAKREQILTTELQRADNLMEDLNRKEAELTTRERTVKGAGEEHRLREVALARRDAELAEGMQALDRMRREHEARLAQADEDRRIAGQARKDGEAAAAEAQKMKAQAEAMQAEVSKNMRFLQKKALDVLDREEKIRSRELGAEERGRLLDSRAQILEQKEKELGADLEEMTAKLEKAKQDNEKLKAKLEEAQRAGPAAAEMDEWKRDIDNRVKIIQRKALELLDREEKLRKKEEELKALAAQLGVQVPQ